MHAVAVDGNKARDGRERRRPQMRGGAVVRKSSWFSKEKLNYNKIVRARAGAR